MNKFKTLVGAVLLSLTTTSCGIANAEKLDKQIKLPSLMDEVLYKKQHKTHTDYYVCFDSRVFYIRGGAYTMNTIELRNGNIPMYCSLWNAHKAKLIRNKTK